MINKKETNGKEDIKQPMRQILIETDGTSIKLVKAEVAGVIELTGILQNLINFINKPKQDVDKKI